MTKMLVALVGGALLLALPAMAQVCSDTTLTGTYLYIFDGMNFRGAAPVSTLNASDPFTAGGRMTLNGLGAGVGEETASLAGHVSDRKHLVSYHVNADCTGTMTLTYSPGAESDSINLVASPDGSEVLTLHTTPDTTASGTLRRVAIPCATFLSGTYRFATSGDGLNGAGSGNAYPPSAAAIPFVSMGIATISGTTITVKDTMSRGGRTLSRNYSSTITWGACRAAFGQIGTTIYFGAGNEFVLVNGTQGTVISGWYRKQ